MRIVVGPLSSFRSLLDEHAPERIVSLLDPDAAFPDAGPAYRGRHLRLAMHDVRPGVPGPVGPAAAHVDRLLPFLAAWTRHAPLLVHCLGGVSRSTAVAFIAACLHNPSADERVIAATLRAASASARPNLRLVHLADVAMGRNGRMVDAVASTGRGLPRIDIPESQAFVLPCSFLSVAAEPYPAEPAAAVHAGASA